MNFIIDGHQDLAFESLAKKRDLTASVLTSRRNEPENVENQVTLGWPEMKKGKIHLIFSTIFLEPPAQREHPKAIGINYETGEDFNRSVHFQIDFYNRLCEQHPEKFRLITDQQSLTAQIECGLSADTADPEDPNPIGLVLLLEGAEGLRAFEDLEEYYERGLRIVGPVWAGGRWCGGTFSPDSMRVTPEGRALLEKLAAQRYILDISHMNTVSANEACDRYEGLVIASHSNCRALLHGQINQRQLSDGTIERLIERDGVMGVIPFNEFLDDSWTSGMQRERVTLGTLAQHIDHICQLAGDADHAAIGSDLDGGFGYPNIPLEMNDISDLPKLEHFLQQRGYTVEDIRKIFHENWMRVLQKGLP